MDAYNEQQQAEQIIIASTAIIGSNINNEEDQLTAEQKRINRR
jgi:hypothetical protein